MYVSKMSFYWVKFTSGYLVHVAFSLGSWSSHFEGPQAGLFPMDLEIQSEFCKPVTEMEMLAH